MAALAISTGATVFAYAVHGAGIAATAILQAAAAYPNVALAATAGGVGVGAAAAFPAVAAVALGAAGFTPAGVGAGTSAAAIQAAAFGGAVPAGGWFAALQAAGAAGVPAVAANAVGTIVGAASWVTGWGIL